MGNSVKISQKIIKNGATLWPNNLTIGYTPIGYEISMRKSYLPFHGHSNIIHLSQDMEPTYMFIKEWSFKENVAHIHLGVPFSFKRNLAICDNMDEPGENYFKWNQPGTKRQIPTWSYLYKAECKKGEHRERVK